MNPNEKLHELGQSIWIDSITREMVGSGTLQSYIDDKAVTGLTSNPSIFDKALNGSNDYDDQIEQLLAQGEAGEELVGGAEELPQGESGRAALDAIKGEEGDRCDSGGR